MSEAKGGRGRDTYDLEELAFHLVLPALAPKLFRYTEHLLNSTGDHTSSGVSLSKRQYERTYGS